MSNWTHVAGIMRVDAIRPLGGEYNFTEILGKELHFDSSSSLWDEAEENPEKFLPMGQEGSLKMSVWDNPRKEELAAYTVSIFGDLRDYHDVDSIIEWFQGKCKMLPIRQACITVSNEWNGAKTWSYEGMT